MGMSSPNLKRENFRILEFRGIRNLLEFTLSAEMILETKSLFPGSSPRDFISDEKERQRAESE
jgi:hypothetical protein